MLSPTTSCLIGSALTAFYSCCSVCYQSGKDGLSFAKYGRLPPFPFHYERFTERFRSHREGMMPSLLAIRCGSSTDDLIGSRCADGCSIICAADGLRLKSWCFHGRSICLPVGIVRFFVCMHSKRPGRVCSRTSCLYVMRFFLFAGFLLFLKKKQEDWQGGGAGRRQT